MNQAVLRQVAHGEVDHPELGRVQVVAQSRDGQVDVRLTVQRPETATILAPHADAIAADARHANIPVKQVTVDRHDGATGSTSQHTDTAGKQGGRSERDRDGEPPADAGEAPPPVEVSSRRVQFVL
jgi:hypothetical protein